MRMPVPGSGCSSVRDAPATGAWTIRALVMNAGRSTAPEMAARARP
jgi:hypothetical protein